MSNMKKRTKHVLCLLLALMLSVLCVGCDRGNANVRDDQVETCKIGIAVYDRTGPEILMFHDYYRNYIAESFPVEFIISDALGSPEEEAEFIHSAKEQGAAGVISFMGLDLPTVLEACAEEEIYYVMASGTVEDDVYEAVKENPWFLGCIGPSLEEEYSAGSDMAEYFAEEGARSFLIVSSGSWNQSNVMHYTRTVGMLTALQDYFGLTYSEDIETLAAVAELTTIETGREDVTITISPGWLQEESSINTLERAFAEGDYDALLGAVGLTEVLDEIQAEIATKDSGMLVGIVNCFSEENFMAVEQKDAQGSALVNYVKGKYASMVAPAFVAVYNAVLGDVDVVNPGGEAFRLYQEYWTARGEEEFVELYSYTQSIYKNAYSSIDLMQVIRAYNENASFEQFKALTEACDIDSVRARLSE